MQTVTATDILSRWPSRVAVLEDARIVNPSLEIVAIHRWFQRGSIPGKYDSALMIGAQRRGIILRVQELADARAFQVDAGTKKKDAA